MKNPIKDNRVIGDITFALRLLSFSTDVIPAGACSEDEKESMMSYATQLLKYQIETCSDENELDYLERCDASKKLDEALEFLSY